MSVTINAKFKDIVYKVGHFIPDAETGFAIHHLVSYNTQMNIIMHIEDSFITLKNPFNEVITKVTIHDDLKTITCFGTNILKIPPVIDPVYFTPRSLELVGLEYAREFNINLKPNDIIIFNEVKKDDTSYEFSAIITRITKNEMVLLIDYHGNISSIIIGIEEVMKTVNGSGAIIISKNSCVIESIIHLNK